MDKVEELLKTTPTWDNVARNDFCRHVQYFPRLLERIKEPLSTHIDLCISVGPSGADCPHFTESYPKKFHSHA